MADQASGRPLDLMYRYLEATRNPLRQLIQYSITACGFNIPTGKIRASSDLRAERKRATVRG